MLAVWWYPGLAYRPECSCSRLSNHPPEPGRAMTRILEAATFARFAPGRRASPDSFLPQLETEDTCRKSKLKMPSMSEAANDVQIDVSVRNGWELRSVGPSDALRTILLVPGFLSTARFYDDVLQDPLLHGGDVRLIAVTPPGFGGRLAFDDLSVGHYALMCGELATAVMADVVVGHSLGANYALEMVAGGHFAGPVVLLSPCFSAEDEERDVRVGARLSRVPILGGLLWMFLPKLLNSAMKGRFPADRHHQLVAEMKLTDRRVAQRMLIAYFDYLTRPGALSERLCGTGVPAYVVRGDRDEIGLSTTERDTLTNCPSVTMVEIPDAAHLVMIDQPTAIAAVIREALDTVPT